MKAFRFRMAWAVFLKEAREVLRDRRTLFLTFGIPLIFYPLLLIAVAEVSASQMATLEAEPSDVAVHESVPDALFEVLEGDSSLRLTRTTTEAWPDAMPDTFEAVVTCDPAPCGALSESGSLTLVVEHWSVEPASTMALSRVQARLTEANEVVLRKRLDAMDKTEAWLSPIVQKPNDRAPPSRQFGALIATFFPTFIMVFMVTGAFYPAIDLTAGEKERKTIQTLLTSPVRPLEVVFGKYLTVFLMAIGSGIVNVLSIALSVSHALSGLGAEGGLGFEIVWTDVAVLLVAVVLLGALFSGLMLSVAIFARTPKDAQSLLSPVYLLCLLPVSLAPIPGVELSALTAFVPVLNLALLMKQVLVSGVVWTDLFLVGLSSLIWAGFCVGFTARLFSREEFLVHDGGLGAGVRLAFKGPMKMGPAGALALLGVLFLGLYYVGAYLQSVDMVLGLVATLYGLVLIPPVLVTWRAKLDFKETFSLRMPNPLAIVGAVLLGVSLTIWLSPIIAWFHAETLPLPQPFIEAMESLFQTPDTLGGKLAYLMLFAVSPAICEEALFRGFLLSRLRTAWPTWLAVVVVGVTFGLFHLSVYRLMGTAILGVVMALLVVRTRSIWPAVIFHALNNGTTLVLSWETVEWAGDLGPVPTMAIAVVASVIGAGLIAWNPFENAKEVT